MAVKKRKPEQPRDGNTGNKKQVRKNLKYCKKLVLREQQKNGKGRADIGDNGKGRVKTGENTIDNSKGKVKEDAKESVFTEDVFNADTENVFQEDASGFTASKKLQRKEKQAKKAERKLDKAKGKLPKEREYALQRVFDEKTGKGKFVIVSLDQEKTFRKDSISKTAVRRLQREGRNYIHSKVSEAEKDNSAVEGAHKAEQKGEDVYHFVKNHKKRKEQKQRDKIAQLEKKHFQKEVNFRYQKFLEENPQMKKKALQKRIQKQRIKREYMKARQNKNAAKSAKEAVGRSSNAVTAVARKIQEIAGKNASVLAVVGIVAVLLITIMMSVSSCGAMFADMQSTVLASSYLSEPEEIDKTDLQFTRLELDLQSKIDRIKTDYPGYDEYSYNLAEIGHDPFTLIGYLSAVHLEFTADEVESEVEALFNEMYTLTLEPHTEIRTRQVQSKDDEGNLLYDENGNPVMEEEEYEVSILRVRLTVKPLNAIVSGKMDVEQAEIYGMYGETRGLLQVFDSPVDLYWYQYISSYYGYRKNPNNGAEEFHRGVDIAVPTGTVVYAAHDGVVTTAAYDAHYGNYVVIEKDGYVTKYAHMDGLDVSTGQSIARGAVIGKSGNTGSSTGSHLHIECLYNGEYYNPLFYFCAGMETIYGEGAGGNVVPPDSYDDADVQALLEEAAKYLGYPYVWGGSSPATSFDCSGYVCWVFTNSGVHNLPRTTAQGIYNQCVPVSAADAKAGDIVFFTGTYQSGTPVTHVGIYCGNGVMIHCGDPISYASINSAYWQSHFYGYGRLN
ncbi:MAG: peptidoglycan DD-metalloendopeptidase family protein [Lachnospiraceae bacterium]|nr:peptidoglycan DD-metalloendopeptidase family protein [Lachnospiraceae bacterium]